MARALPWFPLYVDDLETDEAVRTMTYEELGVLLKLLCWQWREGSIPADVHVLARGLHYKSVRKLKRVLQHCFRDDGSGCARLVNPRLAEVHAEQLSKSEKASAAAKHRWSGRNASALRTQDGRNATQTQIQTQIKKSLSARAESNGEAETA